MQDFKKLTIWQNGIAIVKMIYAITTSFPKNEQYGLSLQMRKSAVSIPSNISEGCGRISSKEFKRFIEIATASTFELETQLLLSDMLNFSNKEMYDTTMNKVIEERKMLISFYSKLGG